METKEIFDTSVAMSKDSGLVTIFSVVEYPPCSDKSFDVIFPDIMDYMKSIEIANKLRKIGKTIGAIDIMIASMCLNRSAKLITKDKDFKVIREIFSNFDFDLL